MAPSAHVCKGLGFHPEILVLQEHGNPQWCPQQEKRRPEGAATIATDSGGLRPEHHHLCRTPSTNDRNPLQPRHLNQKKARHNPPEMPL
jgi:hypothetical protein